MRPSLAAALVAVSESAALWLGATTVVFFLYFCSHRQWLMSGGRWNRFGLSIVAVGLGGY